MNELKSNVPENWDVKEIKEVINREKGKKPNRLKDEKDQEFNIPYLTIDALEKGNANRYTNGEGIVKSSSDDLLIVWDGSRSGYVFKGREGAVCSTMQKVNFTEGITEYLYYFLKSKYLKLNTNPKGTGTPHVNPEIFENLKIPIPPTIKHQKDIVNKIEELNTKLEEGLKELRNIKLNLKNYNSMLVKNAMEGNLTKKWREKNKNKIRSSSKLLKEIQKEKSDLPLGKDRKKSEYVNRFELYELPELWTWCTLGELSLVIGGLTKNKSKRKDYPINVPYLRVANVYSNELKLDEIKRINVKKSELEKALLEKGDLLVVEGNGSKTQIGRLAIWDGSIDPCVHQNHLIKVRLIRKSMNKYVLYWLLSNKARQYILNVASTTSGLYTLSLSKVANLPIPLPPMKEIETISNKIERYKTIIQSVSRNIRMNINRTNKLKNGILWKLFKKSNSYENEFYNLKDENKKTVQERLDEYGK